MYTKESTNKLIESLKLVEINDLGDNDYEVINIVKKLKGDLKNE